MGRGALPTLRHKHQRRGDGGRVCWTWGEGPANSEIQFAEKFVTTPPEGPSWSVGVHRVPSWTELVGRLRWWTHNFVRFGTHLPGLLPYPAGDSFRLSKAGVGFLGWSASPANEARNRSNSTPHHMRRQDRVAPRENRSADSGHRAVRDIGCGVGSPVRTRVEPTGKKLSKFAHNSPDPVNNAGPGTSPNCPRRTPWIRQRRASG